MAGDEVGDHLERHIGDLAVPGIEHAAPDGLVVGDGVLVQVVLLAAVQTGIGGEHALELADGGGNHGAVVPGGGLHGLAAHTLKAAVEPVENRQVGLADPAVAPHALGKVDRAAHDHDVLDHEDVVVKPDVVEVVHGVLDTAPLSVLVEVGLVLVQIAEAAAALSRGMGLAIPEIL